MAKVSEIEKFVNQARRVGAAGLTICSSGNLSWRLDNDEVLLSGTGSWLPELTVDRVSVCRLATGNSRCIRTLEVKHNPYIGAAAHHAHVEHTLHRGFHTVEHLACRQTAHRNPVDGQLRQP